MSTDSLAALEAIVAERMSAADPETSYVARLAAAGLPKIAQKLGEEAVETVIAALSETDDQLIGEASDLVFHLTILLRQRGLGWADISAELDRRHGMSGLEEKARR
ncbi:MAG: phosphoribosyl-ATP diphosphatase [Sphingopyxis sp.]|nr:phosphoribosyl-ATP diphosphatase [Sphingopyxis sp.]